MIASALLLSLALAAPAPPSPGTALERACRAVVDRAAALAPPAKSAVVLVITSPESNELARALETTCLSQLAAAKFKSATPLKASSPEAAERDARAAGADLLLRVNARLEQAELVLSGDAVPTWVNFWTGREPQRLPGGGAITARTLTDAEVLTLAHVSPQLLLAGNAPPSTAPVRYALRQLARIGERVVALAVGDLDGDGVAEVALLSTTAVLVLKADGKVLARRDHTALPRAARPPRDPSGTLSIGDWSPEKGLEIAAQFFGEARGEILALEGAELRVVASLEQAPLAGGALGPMLGAAMSGRNVVAREVRLHNKGKPLELAFEPLWLQSAPRAMTPALLAVNAEGASQLFTPELAAFAQPLPLLGAGAALADLDGDGTPELVASLLTRTDDRLRVYRLDGRDAAPLYESETVSGAFVAGGAGDLDGDGRDDAVLAAWAPDGTTTLYVLGAVPR